MQGRRLYCHAIFLFVSRSLVRFVFMIELSSLVRSASTVSSNTTFLHLFFFHFFSFTRSIWRLFARFMLSTATWLLLTKIQRSNFEWILLRMEFHLKHSSSSCVWVSVDNRQHEQNEINRITGIERWVGVRRWCENGRRRPRIERRRKVQQEGKKHRNPIRFIFEFLWSISHDKNGTSMNGALTRTHT